MFWECLIARSFKLTGIRSLLSASFALFLALPVSAQTNVQTAPTPPPAKFLYLGGSLELAINGSTGALTYLRDIAPLGVGVIDPTDRYTYYNNSAPPAITANQINQSTGEVTPVPGSPFPADPSDVYINIAPDAKGQFLFTAGEDVNSNVYLSVFRIDQSTGAVAETDRALVANAVTSWGPLVNSSDEKYVYVATGSEISAFALNASTGTVSQISGSPFPSGPTVQMATAGKFAYARNSNDTISGLLINSQTGALTQIAGSPFNSPMQQWMSLDPVHHLLYTTNSNFSKGDTVNVITTYLVNTAAGKLTRVAESGQGVLQSPVEVVPDPSGNFVYVGNLKLEGHPACVVDSCLGATSSFKLDTSTGKLNVVTNDLLYPGDPYDNAFSIQPIR